MSDDEFAAAIERALDSIPDEFVSALSNIVLTMDDEPTASQISDAELSNNVCYDLTRSEILGLYEGVPITQRGGAYGNVVPDVITIFKGPHERIFHDADDMIEGIRKTVVHEIGHYYGLDDKRLHEMGY